MTLRSIAAASGACPTYFRRACREASRGGRILGSAQRQGYDVAGCELAKGVASLVVTEYGPEDAGSILNRFEQAVVHQGGPAILDWFIQVLPRCVELVPPRRRARFADGVLRAYAEDRRGGDFLVWAVFPACRVGSRASASRD